MQLLFIVTVICKNSLAYPTYIIQMIQPTNQSRVVSNLDSK